MDGHPNQQRPIMRVLQINCADAKDEDTSKATQKTYSDSGKVKTDTLPFSKHALSKAVLEIDKVQYISDVCVGKLASLATTVQGLKCYIHRLVQRERKFVQMFKIADNMWEQMESQYQNMIKTSKENEAVLLEDVNRIETSFGKYSAECSNLEKELNEAKQSEGKLRRAVEEKEDKLNCLTEQNAVLKRRLDVLNEEIKMYGNNNEIKKQKLKDIENYAAQIKHLQSEIDHEEKNCKGIESIYKERLTKMRADIEKSYKLLVELNVSNECYQSQIRNEIIDQSSILASMKRCSEDCDHDMANVLRNHEKKYKGRLMEYNMTELGTSVTNLDSACDTCTCGTICRNQCVCLFVKTRFLENIYDQISDMLYEELHTNISTISEHIMGNGFEGEALRQNAEDKLKEFIMESVADSLDDTIMAAMVKTNCEITLEISSMLQDCVKRAVEGNRTRKPVPILKSGQYNKQAPTESCPTRKHVCNCKMNMETCVCEAPRQGLYKKLCTVDEKEGKYQADSKLTRAGCTCCGCESNGDKTVGVKTMVLDTELDEENCKCRPAETVETTNSTVPKDKNPANASKLKVETTNKAKNPANASKLKVETTNSTFPKAKNPANVSKLKVGKKPEQVYNVRIEVGGHNPPYAPQNSVGNATAQCCNLPIEVEDNEKVDVEVMEQGTKLDLATCKCVSAESVGLKTMEQDTKLTVEACKCIQTESVERTGCIISQANNAAVESKVGNAPDQCYNLPIEVEDNTKEVGVKVTEQGAELTCKCVPIESVGVKVMERGPELDLVTCKCVPIESVERTGCIMSQTKEPESATQSKIDKAPVQCYNLPIEVVDNNNIIAPVMSTTNKNIVKPIPQVQ